MNNKSIIEAKKKKNDEFYTLFEDVEKEMVNYEDCFAGKTVYCPCDNPDWSSFARYFRNNFDRLRLRRLIVTHYGSKEVHEWFCNAGHTIHEMSNNRRGLIEEEASGSFTDDYCLSLMDESDIIATNPPFSLWIEFMKIVLSRGKDFIVVGSMTSIASRQLEEYVKDSRLQIGFSSIDRFAIPDSIEYDKRVWTSKENYIDGIETHRLASVNACWYTSFSGTKQKEWITTGRSFIEELYPRYINANVIHVERVKDIPDDYAGAMAVPSTFLYDMNWNQFSLVQINKSDVGMGKKFCDDYKSQGKTGKVTPGSKDLVYYDNAGEAFKPFNRVVIIRKGNEYNPLTELRS